MSFSRYDRQERIPGWDQERLKKSLVSIAGDGPLALETALTLGALGIGNLIIMGPSRSGSEESVIDMQLSEGRSRVVQWKECIEKICADTTVHPIEATLKDRGNASFLYGSDVFVDATNSVESKIHGSLYCMKHGIPMISGSTLPGYLKIALKLSSEDNKADVIMPRFDGKPEDGLLSIIAGGAIAEEARKIIHRAEHLTEYPLHFMLGADAYNTFPKGDHPFSHIPFYGKKALIVGNGALFASGAAKAVANAGFSQVDCMDNDIVDETNLNRQIYHYNCVGGKKSENSASYIELESRGRTKARSLCMLFDERFEPDTDYDIIFDWVDNLYTRALLSIFSIRNKIPLVTSATDYKSGEWAAYIPGRTNCMDHYFGIHGMGAEEERIRRQSCTQAATPSVITSNKIAGTASLFEAGAVLAGYPIFNGVKKYSSIRGRKFGSVESNGICDCHERGVEDLRIEDG